MERVRSKATEQGGFVLIFVLILMIGMGTVMSLITASTKRTVDNVQYKSETERLSAIGDAAVDLAVNELWKNYVAAQGGESGSLASFQAFLDDAQIVSAPGSTTGGDSAIFSSTYDPTAASTDLLGVVDFPLNSKNHASLGGAEIHDLSLVREDNSKATVLRVRATVSFGDDPARRRSSTVERLYIVSGEEFSGFGFALLANNVNCIMCHARVDTADRFYNADASLFGTYSRAKVGTLESLVIRSGKAESNIAGTLYTRGHIFNKDGTVLQGLSGTTLTSALFDNGGLLVEDSSGALTTTEFQAATGDPLPALENLYLEYPTDPAAQTDGILPTQFPPVIPDDNGNRAVDPEEFALVAESASGVLSGGFKQVVAPGSTYSGTGLPTQDVGTLSGVLGGNVVLRGTPDNPIVLNGRIAVDGDVVIEGVVKGSGVIVASGNLYVVGSIRYADGVDSAGNRTFGVAQDGTQNKLTLAAGGNLLVGDFLRDKRGATLTGDSSGAFNFTLSELELFNRAEWTRTQQTLPGEGGTSVVNPLFDPSYLPRYYVLREGNPVYLMNSDSNQTSSYFDPVSGSWMGREHNGKFGKGETELLPGSPEYASARVVALTPESWLSDSQLISIWEESQANHPGGPFQIDALLYTNNATFLLARKSSVYGGQVVLNGGLVGSDMGILVPGNGGVGLQLNYDERQDGSLVLRDTSHVQLMRSVRLR